MIRNYFLVAVRALLKYKGYTAINVIGLSLGLIAGTFILLYVSDELSFDQFHEKKDRLYRVNTFFGTPEEKGSANETNGWPVGKILEKEYPEVEQVLYTRSASFLMVNHEGKRFRQNNHFASPEFFTMFSFPLVEGNSATALVAPNTVVISEAMKQKFFPEREALHQTLTFADSLTFTVTGVMKNIPSYSHIQADMILSFATYERLVPDFNYSEGWGNINVRNYVLLKDGAGFDAFAQKAKTIYMDRVRDMLKQWGVEAHVVFEPVGEIYLHTESGNGMGPLGSMNRLHLLIAIASFVILLACINFINLTTARAMHRAKEVGLRKVVGSSRGHLILQYLSESATLTAFALMVGLALFGVLLPFFNLLLNKNYSLQALAQPQMLMGIAALFVVITLLSGYYPAWVLSAMKPTEVLKGKIQTSVRGIQLRRGLVIFQFVISTALVTGTIIVLQQLSFMEEQSLGFQKDQILSVNLARVNAPSPTSFESFKDEVKRLALVNDVSYANALPGTPGWQGQVAYPEGQAGEKSVSVEYMAIDDRYLDVLGLQLVAGRNFDLIRTAELEDGLILNEAAVSVFGWASPEEAIGKRIESPSGTPAGEVIGVVKNYHQQGLQQNIGPIAMDYAPNYAFLYAINFKPGNTQQLLGQLSELWKKHFPGYDFNYFFLDESFEKQYQGEHKIANVFTLFSIVTIVIASIGLLGLASFTVTVRTKEIGVRKLLGASSWSIVKLINTEFVVLVIISVVVSVPLVWYYAQQWLQQFAYRMEIQPIIFVMTLAIALAATLAMVSLQSLRATRSNPADSLRTE